MDQSHQTTPSAYTRSHSDPYTDKPPGPPSAVARLQTSRPSTAKENQNPRAQIPSRRRSHLRLDYRLRSLHQQETARPPRNHHLLDSAPREKLRAADARGS